MTCIDTNIIKALVEHIGMNSDEIPIGGAKNAFDTAIDDSMLEPYFAYGEFDTLTWTEDCGDWVLTSKMAYFNVTDFPIGIILKAKDEYNAEYKYFICRDYYRRSPTEMSCTFVDTQNNMLSVDVETDGKTARFVSGMSYFTPLSEKNAGFYSIKLPETVPFTIRHFISIITFGIREIYRHVSGDIYSINNTLESHNARISTLESR